MKKYFSLAAVAGMCMLCMCAKVKPPKGAVIGVNGEWIQGADIDYVAEMFRQQVAKFSPQSALQSVSPELRKNAARQLIAELLLTQEAKKRKIVFEGSQFDTLYKGFRKQMGDEATFQRMLTSSGRTEEEFKQQVRDGLTVDSLVKLLAAKTDTITLAECKDYYDKNSAKFTELAKVRASQILLEVPKNASPEKKSEIRKKAEKICADAKSGKDFTALARTCSQDASAKSGGDLGWFRKGDMRADVDSVIFGLADNGISSVLATELGFHIFKRTGTKQSEPKHFFEVSANIKATLELKKKNDFVTRTVDSLTRVAKIVYVDTSLTLR
jgi:parvulin-like peptidyl-prolyl isomerase